MLKLKQFIYAILLFILGIAPMSVLAIGQVTDPIVINDALRGEEFTEEMIIINTESRDIVIGLSAEGDIAEWASFYTLDNLETPINSVSLASEQKLNMIVRFAIPKDVENGEYKGTIGVSEKSEETEGDETASALTQRIDREATITVSDNENIELAVSVIPESYDIKSGDPLIMRIIYNNNGNISLSPQIDFKLKNIETDEIVYNVIFPYSEEDNIKPATQYEIPQLEVSTDDFEAGKYSVKMDILYNGKTITDTDFNLTIKSGSNLQILSIVVVVVVVIILIIIFSRKGRKGTFTQHNND